MAEKVRRLHSLERISGIDSLEDRAYSRIKEAILDLALRPGVVVKETELAQQLGVSTTPVRRALRRLADEGLVTLSYARSPTVSVISMSDIREIFELREVLETWALRKGVPSFTEEDLRRGEELADEAQAAVEAELLVEFSRLNNEFHRFLCSKANNARLLSMLDSFGDQLHRIRMAQEISEKSAGIFYRVSLEALKGHREILEAIRRGDPSAAESLLRKDIDLLSDLLERGEYPDLESILNPTG